jgi:threonine synthase
MEAIKRGISDEGGLFVPEDIPAFQSDRLKELIDADYRQRAAEILGLYLTDYSRIWLNV